MAKSIVFCADGTWNGPGDPPGSADIDGAVAQDADLNDNVTNVVNLFANLSGQITPQTQPLHNEPEKVFLDASGAVLQISKYLHGVGDSNNLAVKVLGGVFGVGVITRIVRGYTFISRNYKPGDSIHIVGFSRGAYTARALAGMIAKVGLLNPATFPADDKTQAYVRGFEAWMKSKEVSFSGIGKFGDLLTALTVFADDVITRIALKDSDFIPVRIQSVAVWDTVGAMGIPSYIQGRRRDLFSFVDTKLSPLVDHGFHAMALDEERLDFPITRWDQDSRIEQLWFVGAHSDVGGGYPAPAESGLSDIALDWLMKKLAGAGVRFASPPQHALDLTRFAQNYHEPWDKVPFNIGPQRRVPQKGDVFHPTVKQHWSASNSYQTRWPESLISGLPGAPSAPAAISPGSTAPASTAPGK